MLLSPFCLNLSYLCTNWSSSCNPLINTKGTFTHTILDYFSGNTVKHVMPRDIEVGTDKHVISDYSVVCIYIQVFTKKKVTICILCFHRYREPLFMINKVKADNTTVITRYNIQRHTCKVWTYISLKIITKRHFKSIIIHQCHCKEPVKFTNMLFCMNLAYIHIHIYIYDSNVILTKWHVHELLIITKCESPISLHVHPVLHAFHWNKMSHLLHCNLDGNIIYFQIHRNNSQLRNQFTWAYGGIRRITK